VSGHVSHALERQYLKVMHCFVYVVNNRRASLQGRMGIACPYGAACCGKMLGASRTAAGCELSDHNTEINPEDLAAIVQYGSTCSSSACEASRSLQMSDVDKLKDWINPQQADGTDSLPDSPSPESKDEQSSSAYIQMTTKACPSCGKPSKYILLDTSDTV
jgi:hypothetical protein